MSFGGSTDNIPQQDPSLFGMDEMQATTAQEARPVPLFWGTPERIAPTVLTNRFDVTYETHESKKAGETREYYCSTAGLIGRRCDALVKIYADRQEVWPKGGAAAVRSTVKNTLVLVKVTAGGGGYSTATQIIASNGALVRPVVREGKIVDAIVLNPGSACSVEAPPTFTASVGTGATFEAVVDSESYITLNIEGLCAAFRFYWGTENTDFDPDLLRLSADTGRNPAGMGDNSQEEHPAYQGQSKFVAVLMRLGNSRTNVPNLEFVVSRFPDVTGITAPVNQEGDCNPMAALYDALTDTRSGLGLSTALLDLDNFDTVALQLRSEGLGVSPLLNTSEDFSGFIVRLMEYIHGYLITGPDGRLKVGLIRNPGCIVSDPSTPYLDEAALTGPPRLQALNWDDTSNQIYVNYTDGEEGAGTFKAKTVSAQNRTNYRKTGEPRMLSLDRPWFTKAGMADLYARTAAQIYGVPKAGGTITVRESKIGALDVGGIFKLSWNHWSMCYLFCRVTEMAWENAYGREVTITFERDRGYLIEQATQAPVITPPITILPVPQVPTAIKVIELPYQKEYGTEPYLAALVARPDKLTSQFIVWVLDEAGNGTNILQSGSFAYYGSITEEFLCTDTGTLKITLDGGDKILPSGIQALPAAENRWLLIMGDEIMSISTADLVPGEADTYELTVLRERFDSKRANHAASAEAFILPASALQKLIFKTGRDSGQDVVATFKIQTKVLSSVLPLADCPGTVVIYQQRAARQWKPRNLAVNGTKWFESPTYTTGQDFVVTWDRVNRNGGDGSAGWDDNLANLWYLDIMDGETVLETLTFAATDETTTITNAHLQALLGGEGEFRLRLYASQTRDDTVLDSLYFDEAVVTLV